MSMDVICPFCDSSDERILEGIPGSWEKISEIICDYFSNFTKDHLRMLCDSCYTYVQEFCNFRKLWSTHEGAIHKKRRLGQFKGLKDFVNLKNKSSVVCRLCFKESRTEDVIFIYLESEIYQPGYIQNMMSLHASDIDLNVTENPVICQECFDAIQTFDALYQMCLENQAGKLEGDLKIKSLADSKNCGNLDDTEKIVHVQLKKTSNNSLVLRTVTEAESAVNSLIKNKESPRSSVVLNGWTTKSVFDLVQNPKCNERKSKDMDVFVISDEDDDAPTKESTNSKDNSSALKNTESRDSVSEDEENHLAPERCSRGETLEIQSSESDVIEIDDSDEEPVGLPKILNVTTLDESEETMESQLQNNSEEGDVDVDAISTIDIDMRAVSGLFRNNEADGILRKTSSTESDVDSIEVTSVDDSSNSNNFTLLKTQPKDILEENLSDFLQFNKNSNMDAIPNSLERCNDSINNNGTAKRMRLSTVDFDEVIQTENTSRRHESYSSAFEKFLMSEKDKTPNIPGWKLLRGFLFHGFKDDDYCSWYPFISPNKKQYPSNARKYYITVMENRRGTRFYRCNICLHVMTVSQVNGHRCPKSTKKRSLVCLEPKCGFYTFNDFLFSQHKKAHTVISNEMIRSYKCSLCEFFSSDKQCMTNHKKIHETGTLQLVKGSKCTFCFFHSVDPDILAHHIAVRHSERKTKFTEKHFG